MLTLHLIAFCSKICSNHFLKDFMKIRQATPADNQALLELSRRSPMAAQLVVNNDRTPDYFYIDELLGEKSLILVAEEAGRIIGTVAVVFRNVFYRNEQIPIAYIGGIKIENPAQNRLLAFRLMKYVMDFLMDTPVKFGLILVIGANRAMEALLSGRAGIPQFDLVSRYQDRNLILMPGRGLSGRYQIRSARTDDLGVMASLYRQFYSDYELKPDWSEQYLAGLYRQKDFFLENTYLAFQQDSLVAALSLWDQTQFKNTVISHYGGKYAILKKILSPLRLVPEAGQALSEMVIRHLAFREGSDTAARDLIRLVMANHRRKYRFIRCAFPLGSEPARILGKFLGLSISVNFYTVFRPGDPERESMVDHLRQSPVWEDLSLH